MTLRRDDDRALVSRVLRNRDERAFGALYDRHTPYLYRFALRLTGGDDVAAQDVVHDSWMSAVAGLSRFQWRAELRTWLAGIVVNQVRSRGRSTREVQLHEEMRDSSDVMLQHTLERVDIERAIALLAPGYRQVLVLHDVEGYTHEQIAMLLEIDVGTSKSQLSRARAAVRRALRPENPSQSNGER